MSTKLLPLIVCLEWPRREWRREINLLFFRSCRSLILPFRFFSAPWPPAAPGHEACSGCEPSFKQKASSFDSLIAFIEPAERYDCALSAPQTSKGFCRLCRLPDLKRASPNPNGTGSCTRSQSTSTIQIFNFQLFLGEPSGGKSHTPDSNFHATRTTRSGSMLT